MTAFLIFQQKSGAVSRSCSDSPSQFFYHTILYFMAFIFKLVLILSQILLVFQLSCSFMWKIDKNIFMVSK